MSQSIPFSEVQKLLPMIRGCLRRIKQARIDKGFKTADQFRHSLLIMDSGMRITIDKNGKVSLWHYPDPPFSNQFHYCNYNEFIANSEENGAS